MHLKVCICILFVIPFISCVEKKKSEPKIFEIKSMVSPANENSSLPYLFSNSETTLLSWVEKPNDSLVLFRYSELENGSWQAPLDITSGTDWFVNWADFPSIVEHKGNLFSHILKKSSVGTYSYDVKMNLKQEGAKNWNSNIPLHKDGTPTEHGFVTALPYGENSFFVTWLDGRNTEEKAGEERGAMTIRAAEVSSNGKVTNEHLLDARTCDCCQTTAAITAKGPVVIYRDRSENEIRDISIVRQIKGEWTTPKSVHNDDWKIKGCPVNGPKAAAFENTLVVAWFTEANKRPTIKVSFSNDNGISFQKPIVIGTSNVTGRVDIALVDSKTALVSYLEVEEKKGYLKVVKVQATGEPSDAKTISEMNSSRKSGFPQMELVKGKVFFAWTEVKEEATNIRTSIVEMEAF